MYVCNDLTTHEHRNAMYPCIEQLKYYDNKQLINDIGLQQNTEIVNSMYSARTRQLHN